MSIEVGSKLSGKITGITHFGAFVLLPGGVTGLVHISEISDEYVKDIHDYLKINDEVTVKVLNVDPSGKIALSIRQAQDNPSGRQGRRGRPRQSFEDKLSRFMRESEDRLQALRRSESKRGGRGGRRG
ncbi:MAG: RNA-binding protein S1 [Thermoflavifilum sp.]|nr:RNA-binding protein S1 [Thermoflavifilum sp.]MCL6513739.1 RNA-binding protein S1 [Alicyclobacillus sp.]